KRTDIPDPGTEEATMTSKRKKENNGADHQLQLRKSYEAVLSIFGAGIWFRNLQGAQKNALVKWASPRPKVILDSTLTGHDTENLVRRARDMLRDALAQPLPEYPQISAADWFSVAPNMHKAFSELKHQLGRKEIDRFDKVVESLDDGRQEINERI